MSASDRRTCFALSFPSHQFSTVLGLGTAHRRSPLSLSEQSSHQSETRCSSRVQRSHRMGMTGQGVDQ